MKNAILRLKQINIEVAAVSLASALLVGFLLLSAFNSIKTYRISIAVGPPNSETYVMMHALKTVAEKRFPRIEITLHETVGSKDNLERLRLGTSMMATAQGNLPVSVEARRVAVLFENQFHLFVHKNSTIQQFWDLKGRKVALPSFPEDKEDSWDDQFGAFMYTARHFGLDYGDFTFVGNNDEAAGTAFTVGPSEAEAVFRIRPPHNASIAVLAGNVNMRFIPIPEADAIHIERPGYSPAKIVKGSYKGSGREVNVGKGQADKSAEKPAEKPAATVSKATSAAAIASADRDVSPVPASDIDTLGVKVNLLAREDMDPEPVRLLLQVLMEMRPELAAAAAKQEAHAPMAVLFGSVSQPTSRVGFEPPLHAGASTYFSPVSVPFVVEHANSFTAVILALLLVAAGWIVKGRLRGAEQVAQANGQNRRIMELMEEARTSTSDRQIEPIRTEMLAIFSTAVSDLTEARITKESFQSFQSIWSVGYEAIRARRRAIRVWEGSTNNKR